MRHALSLAAILAVVVPGFAQEIDISSLDDLRDRASNVVELDLNPSTMELAETLLAENDLTGPVALRIVESLEGLQVRVFEFEQPGQYSSDDLAPIRQQLQAANWHRLVEVRDDDENVGVWMRMGGGEDFRVRSEVFDERFSNDGGLFRGMAVLVEEPEELVFVNITGNVRLADLAALGAQFGIPFLGRAAANENNENNDNDDNDDNDDEDRESGEDDQEEAEGAADGPVENP
jgi:hypothetical protein